MRRLILVAVCSLFLGSSYGQRLVEYFKPIAVHAARTAALATDAAGKIYLGGDFQYFDGELTGGLVRMDAAGKRDNTFNVPPLTVCTKIYPQPNGKLYFVGSYPMPDGTYLEFVRLNGDGSYDPSFTPTQAPSLGGIRDIGVQSNGKVIIVGNHQYSGSGGWATSRLLPNGQPDASFPAYIPVFGTLSGGAQQVRRGPGRRALGPGPKHA